MPLKKEINSIFRAEKARLMSNPRFSIFFSNIEIKYVFSNKANLKKTHCKNQSRLTKNKSNRVRDNTLNILRTLGRRISILFDTQGISNKQ